MSAKFPRGWGGYDHLADSLHILASSYSCIDLLRRNYQCDITAYGPILQDHDGNKTSKWRYKMHVISHTKNDFLRFWLRTFILLEESWRAY